MSLSPLTHFVSQGENAITYGTGHTAASVREALRDIGINLQPTIRRDL